MLLKMIRLADQYGVTFDTVQMPLNVMDAHYDSFQQNVLPVALEKNMGVIAMKCFGDNFIMQSKTVTPFEAFHYTMNLPISTLVVGCEWIGYRAAGAGGGADLSADDRNAGRRDPREDGGGREGRSVRILQDARHLRRNVEESEVARLTRKSVSSRARRK